MEAPVWEFQFIHSWTTETSSGKKHFQFTQLKEQWKSRNNVTPVKYLLFQAGHLLLLDAPTLLTLGKEVAITVPLMPTYQQQVAKVTYYSVEPVLPINTQPSQWHPLPWLAWLGLLISLLLTSLTLSLLSWLSPYQRSHSHLSLLDSLWCSASTMFLSLPHARLKVI